MLFRGCLSAGTTITVMADSQFEAWPVSRAGTFSVLHVPKASGEPQEVKILFGCAEYNSDVSIRGLSPLDRTRLIGVP